MKDKYFDLFVGGNKKIVLPDNEGKNELKVELSQRSKANLPFFKKCKFPENKDLDGVSDGGLLLESFRPKPVKHGFFKQIKKMVSVAVLVIGIFVISSGISSGVQKKNQLIILGQSALSKGESGASAALNGDMNNALQMLNETEFYLSQMQMNINFLLNRTENLFNYTSDIESLDAAIKFADEVNSAAKTFLMSFEKIKNIGSELSLDTNYIDLINNIFNGLKEADSHLQTAKINLEKLENSQLAKKYLDEISTIDGYLSKALIILDGIGGHQEALKILLGDAHPHTVMFLFQNSHEIRANGGFIGSLLFVTFNDGKIVDHKFKDVFDFDSQLHDGIEPPEPFGYISENWGLRDANYYPNFSDSAKKIRWFLEQEKGDSVDTIIALDEQVIEKFLEKTGELPLFEDGENVNADNFSMMLSFFVEAKIFGENTPKKVLENFMPIFLDNVKKLKTTDLLSIISEVSAENHISAFSYNSNVEQFFSDLGISGEMKIGENQDFLSVVNTSISANKSDGFINENISHKTYVNLKGEIFDKVIVTRSHIWGESEDALFAKLFSEYGLNSLRDKEALKFILGAGRNQVWTRVYVPIDSAIKTAVGINIDDIKISIENGFTVFSFYYPAVNASENKTVEITYALKNKLKLKSDYSAYRFCFQKAAGINQDYLTKDLEFEEGLEVIDSSDIFPYEKNQKTDKCFSILFGKESLAQG